MKARFRVFVVVASVLALASSANIAYAVIAVQVGYADGLRPSPFFPSPWQGGAGVALFAGGASTLTDYDAGAIRVINTDAVNHTINALTVDSFGDGSSYSIWLEQVLSCCLDKVRSLPKLQATISILRIMSAIRLRYRAFDSRLTPYLRIYLIPHRFSIPKARTIWPQPD